MLILKQNEYAFKDYEGLDEIARAELKEKRSELAKELLKSEER